MRSYKLLILFSLLSVLVYMSSCAPPTACIAEGTQITTPSGDMLIEKLQIGDIVYSYDLATQQLVSSKVLFIKKSFQLCYQFQTSENIKLIATLSHPIYSPQTGNYELAEKWLKKELTDFAFVNQNQSFISLSSSSVIPVGKKVVYDITVDSPHANFIANGFLVHNKSPQPTNTGPIEDLEIISKTDSSLTLIWSALGNNALYVTGYDMRISDTGINYNNWGLHDSVTNLPIPKRYGAKDTVEIKGLNSKTIYWINLRTLSNFADYSEFGNQIVDSTL